MRWTEPPRRAPYLTIRRSKDGLEIYDNIELSGGKAHEVLNGSQYVVLPLGHSSVLDRPILLKVTQVDALLSVAMVLEVGEEIGRWIEVGCRAVLSMRPYAQIYGVRMPRGASLTPAVGSTPRNPGQDPASLTDHDNWITLADDNPPEPPPLQREEIEHVVELGNRVTLEIANHSAYTIHFAILDLLPLYGIERLSPRRADYEDLKAGTTKHIKEVSLEVPGRVLKHGGTSCLDILKLSVNTSSESLGCLALKSIGKLEEYSGGSRAHEGNGIRQLWNRLSGTRDAVLGGDVGDWQVVDSRVRTKLGFRLVIGPSDIAFHYRLINFGLHLTFHVLGSSSGGNTLPPQTSQAIREPELLLPCLSNAFENFDTVNRDGVMVEGWLLGLAIVPQGIEDMCHHRAELD
ncbi:hypothetical protein MKZ38_005845 [Zalerion maritima]|uniref:Uncharacterized protein n=1 Tax=Zalerion maritima TaxID=339359 RepID=A0AAD5WQQ5_9PEZI|nr:hypothetical protein MKZ38_005845 [Zalerion maritima]